MDIEKGGQEVKMNSKIAVIFVILVIIVIGVTIVKVQLNKNESEINKQNQEIKDQAQEGHINLAEYSDNNFPIEFLKIENKGKNIIYSPLSIKYALKMLEEGAGGNTKEQILKVIGNANTTKYNNIDNVMSLANAMYIKKDYSSNIKEIYKNILNKRYNAEINYDEFKNADNINKWIENKTLGKIKDMLEDEMVKSANMILVNALAIDMEWNEKFDEEKTYGQEFYLENGEIMIATTMHQKVSSDNFSYYKDNDVTLLRMDLKEYNDTQLDFNIIMPSGNLSEYVQKFNMNEFYTIVDKAKLASETSYGLEISVPRFKYEYDLKLKQDLQELGITDAFNANKADFTKISDEKFYASDALHKANIELSEKGTKAGAATVIIMKATAALVLNEPEKIKIDKPFLYVIRDKKTGEIWFVGTVYEPNLWENDKADYERK